MSTAKMPTRVEYQGLDGQPHVLFVQLVNTKTAARIFHTLLGAAGRVDRNALSESAALGAWFATLPFDDFWSMACDLLRYSTRDDVEIKDLETSDAFSGSAPEINAAVFAALGANFPDFFGSSGGSKKSTLVAAEAASQ